MKHKVLLIRSTIPGAKGHTVAQNQDAIMPPLGLMYLSSCLKKWGRHPYDVKLLDVGVEMEKSSELQERINAYAPDFVGISGMTCEEFRILEISEMVKNYNPECPVILGGPYASSDSKHAASQRHVDFVAVNEAEYTLVDLLDTLAGGGDASKVKGFMSRNGNGSPVFSGEGKRPETLDDLPFPDWDLVNLDDYACSFNFNAPFLKRERYFPLFTSRGCPYHCIYCHNLYGKQIRLRSIGNILEELGILYERYGVREIQIIDDIFNLHRERVLELCGKIVERGWDLSISFPNGVRGDILDRETIEALKDAGCYSMTFAVETTSQRLQKLLQKNLLIQKLVDNVRIASELKIITFGFFMIGFPTETREEMLDTLEFAEKSLIDFPRVFQVRPHPGTPLFDLAVKEGFDPQKYQSGHYTYFSQKVNCSPLEDEDFHKLYSEGVYRINKANHRILRQKEIFYGGLIGKYVY
jgi:radical SAM superfamily enzyme YgiQ (UPF0313 family)